jgi:hypothetical protein
VQINFPFKADTSICRISATLASLTCQGGLSAAV